MLITSPLVGAISLAPPSSARASILDLSLHVTVVSLSTLELRVMKYFSG